MNRRELFAALASLLVACEGTPPPRAPGEPQPSPLSRRLVPNEVLPKDLDLVVRLDLARLKETLGARSEEELAARFSKDGLVARALRGARTLTLALRSSDIDLGDHVIVVESDAREGLSPDELGRAGFREQASANDKLRVFLREEAGARDATHLVLLLDQTAVAFVSSAEVDAVLRVLAEGADDERGQPVAEGVVSADVRPRRLRPDLERRFPSIGALIAQVNRIRARFSVSEAGFELDADVIAASAEGATRLDKFLAALREGADQSKSSALLRKLRVEPLGTIVHVSALFAPQDIAALVFGDEAAMPPERSAPPAPETKSE